jgi:glutathione synthase/RimK-type ligase-like ATP-grasp enzyme
LHTTRKLCRFIGSLGGEEMSRLKIIPYKMGSTSAKALARELGVKRIIPGGRYNPTMRTTVLNWGSSAVHFRTANIINKPEAVSSASNKLTTLLKLKEAGVPVPDFTTDPNVAKSWLDRDYKVVCRHKLSSHSGIGIEIVRPGGRIPYAPLYTKYTKKHEEYRVHVFGNQVIDIVEKRKRNGGEADSLIRTHSNGWVFCRDGVYPADGLKAAAIKAVSVLGLDFGAVDVIARDGKFWILEVNTAPGLENTTLRKYVDAIRNYTGGRQVVAHVEQPDEYTPNYRMRRRVS